MKIDRLLGKCRGTISRFSRIGVVAVYVAVLGVFLSLGVLSGVPRTTPAVTLLYTVDTAVIPVEAGTFSYASPTVWDGEKYCYQNSLLITLVPAPGWHVDRWVTSVPTSWINGNVLLINTGSSNWGAVWSACDGSFTVNVYMARDAVTLQLRSDPYAVYTTSAPGTYSFSTDQLYHVVVDVNPLYDGTVVFDHWTGGGIAIDQVNAISDIHNEDIYVSIDMAIFSIDSSQCWLQPVYRSVSDYCQIVWAAIPEGHGAWDHDTTDNVPVGQGVVNRFVPDTGWGIDHFEILNGRVTPENSPTSENHTWFGTLANGSSTAVVHLYDTSEYNVYQVTISKQGSGTITPAAGTYEWELGRYQKLTAVPAVHWEFDHWEMSTQDSEPTDGTYYYTVTDNATIKAVFLESTGGGGGGTGGGGGAAAAEGIWGGITNSLSSVGLGNAMGRMMVVLAGMVVAAVVCGKNKTMGLVAPLGVLGIGIIGFWVPIWIVILLAIGVGVGLLGWFGKRTSA